MSKMARLVLILSLLLCGASAHARYAVVVFPLVDNDSVGADLSHWASCVPAEALARASRYVDAVRVWDPIFMYQIDSSICRLDNDSLLLSHQARWSWDLALGGGFTTSGDTIHLTVRAARIVDGQLRKRVFKKSGRSMIPLMRELIVDVFVAMEEPRIGSALAANVDRTSSSEQAYRTFVAGYCFELHQNNHAALSAYLHALDKDANLAFAAVHMAGLYAQSRNAAEAQKWIGHAALRAGNDPVVIGEVANYYVAHGSPARATKYVQTHTEVLGATADGLLALGRHRLNLGSHERAIGYLTKAVAYGFPNLEADFVLGQAYLSAGKLDMAAEVFNRLVTYRPRHARYYSFLGAAYRRLGRLMESVDVLSAACKMHPNDAPLMIHLASTYAELGWFDEAERLLLHARQISPALSEIDQNLIVIYWRQGRREEARKLLRQGRQSKHTLQARLNNEAGMQWSQGEYRAALRRLRQAEESGPKTEEILYNLGITCLRLNRHKEAAEWFDELLRMVPDRLDVLLLKAQIDIDRGDLKSAAQALRHILRISPHNERAVTALAQTLVQLEREREATDVLEGYLNEFPSDMSARLALADICRELEWYDVAALHYKRAATQTPTSFEAQLGLGRCLYALTVFKGRDQADRAFVALKKAQTLRPDAAEPDYYLGCLYLEHNKERALAKTFLEQAARKAKDRQLRDDIDQALRRAGEER